MLQKISLIIIILLFSKTIIAQNTIAPKPIARKGFIFGVGIGAGTLKLNTNDTVSNTFSTTIPNIKIGYMVNKNLAVSLLLPGANYKYQNKDRGFEAYMLTAQYWIKNNWWVLGGAGLTFDAPAFYTVKDPKTAGFYFGLPALTFATGYELWHKGKFALDAQYRFFYGKSTISNEGHREGIAQMFMIGFNWY